MALNEGTQKIWLKIKDGKFYRTSDKECEHPFSSADGVITGIKFKMEQFEGRDVEKLVVTFTDAGSVFEFAVGFDSSYATSMISFLKSVDITKKVVFIPKFSEEGGKAKRALLVSQDNNKAKAYYTKDTPNGLPQMKQVKLNGKLVWDKGDMMEFLRKVVETEFIPSVSGNKPVEKEEIPDVPGVDDYDQSGLPF